MKNVLKAFIILFSLTCFSCQDEAEIIETQANTSIADGDIAIIRSLGLDETTVIDKGDYYLIEGDIALNKENLRKSILSTDNSGLQLRHGIVPSRLLSIVNAQNITIKIDGSVPTTGRGAEWRDAVVSAISAWNNIPGSCIKFVLTTGSANLTVKAAYDKTNNALAWTDLPFNNKPTSELFVNTFFNDYDYKANTIVHEFGHVVGLLHTHVPLSSQDKDGIIIPGTPDIDTKSIMSHSRERYYFPGFNSDDLKAIIYLYPSPIIASSNLIGTNEIVTYTLPNYSGSATWSATSNVLFVSGQNTIEGVFKGSGNGYASVKAEVTYSGCTYSLTNNNSVWVGIPRLYNTKGQGEFILIRNTIVFDADPEGKFPFNTYVWTLDKGACKFKPSEDGGRTLEITPTGGNSLEFHVDATNKYGTTRSYHWFRPTNDIDKVEFY